MSLKTARTDLYARAIAFALAAASFAAVSARDRDSDAPSRVARCGPNALYIAVKLLRANTTYQEVDAILPSKLEGCSLLDLKRAAPRFGVKLNVVKTDIDHIHSVPLPAIAHTLHHGPLGTGHYLVVVRVDDEGIHCIDGTTARLGVYPCKEFEEFWTGYLLVPTNRPGQAFPIALLVGSLCLLPAAVVLVWNLYGIRVGSFRR